MSLSTLGQYNPGISFGHPPPPPPQQEEPPRARKQTRITRACDFCHSRSTKCKQNPTKGESCLVCLDFSQPCTYNRPTKKRGIPGKAYKPPPAEPTTTASDGVASRDGESDARMLLELTNGIPAPGVPNMLDGPSIPTIPAKWKGMVLANEPKIQDLMEVYHLLIHPVYPLFHYPTLKLRIESRQYITDVTCFAEVMAMCSLAGLRATDQVLTSGRFATDHSSIPSHREFYEAADAVIPKNATELRGLPWLRTIAVMALYGLQNVDKRTFQQHMGLYHTVIRLDDLEDEIHWPKDISLIEVEERRRLFWSMYQVEILTSVLWGCKMRFDETQISVAYPSEIADDYISAQSYGPPNASSSFFTTETVRDNTCWLHGWNFNTDLHRVLERSVRNIALRQRTSGSPLPLNHITISESDPDQDLGQVMSLHASLPPDFKGWKEASGETDILSDRFGLQAADILITLQMIRVVLYNGASMAPSEKISVAVSVLEIMNQVPVIFLKTLCTPHAIQFASVAHLLRAAMEGTVSIGLCNELIQPLRTLADIINGIENGVSVETPITKFLYEKIAFIIASVNHITSESQNGNQEMKSPSPDHPNIDPTLQSGNMLSSSSVQLNGDDNSEIPATLRSEPQQEQYFQLPLAIVEHWPWNFDVSRGFGR